MNLYPWKRPALQPQPEQNTSVHFTVERMYCNHVPQISRIEESSFPHPWPVQAFNNYIADPHFICRVVIVDAKVAGYIVLEKSPVSLQIINLAVDQAHRKMGLGRFLINDQIAALNPRISWQSFLAPVAESNLPAQLFFKSCGFRCISWPRRFFTNGKTAYLFQYRIGDQQRKNSLHRNRLIATMQGGEVR